MTGNVRELVESAIRKQDGNRTFFEQGLFPWVEKVESRWLLIREELDLLLSAVELLPGFEEIQVEQRVLTQDKRWKVFPLFAYGEWVNSNKHRCPETVKALMEIDGLKAAMFSILQPKKVLDAHLGPYSGVLRYHLGLKVPKPESQCGICVGGDYAMWYEGKSLIFDDSHLHNAWNNSDEERVVLFVDFARPLPPDLARMNNAVIEEISNSDFIRGAVRKWEEWELKYGSLLDQHLAKNVVDEDFGTL